MKSATFFGKHDIRIVEAKIPEIAADEILIRVQACGVCGTDVHIFEGDEGAAAVTPPTILGHEFSGIIEKTGKDVANFQTGDRVCVDPNRICGACRYCLSGDVHFCEHMTGYGTTVNGGFAEYCAVKASQAHLLADTTTFEAGAMAEPLSCCLHGADMCDVQSGDSVVIIGAGMIGLIMLQLMRLSGAARIAVLEPVAEKRKMAETLGASFTIDPTGADVPAVLRAHAMEQIDCVIECAGLPATIRQAIEIAGKKATVMMFGLTKPNDEISVRPFEIFKKELTLRASYINPNTISRAIALINAGRIDVTSMVAGVEPLEKLPEILSDPAVRRRGKFIMHP